MEGSITEWWRRHGWTVALLLTAFGLALLVRTVFMVPLVQQYGSLYVYGGGSDSFYHSRVTTYIILNHANLVRDYSLNYPVGAINPREPLFDWMNAILGILFSPFFGGNAVEAGAFFLQFGGPLWAALSVFPIYLIGREVSSARMGLVAALLYPFVVASIDSSTFGYANYLGFYSFFILLFIYSYLRTVKAAGTRRWVESYRRPKEIPRALRAFLRGERAAVRWAVFAGVSLGALALAWQGYTLAVTVVIIFLFFALIVERIRHADSFGLYVTTWIVGLVAFPMAVPYYLPQGLFAGWFDLPLLMYFGGLAIALPFVALRDQPWVISIPILGGIAAAALAILDFVNKGFFQNIVTGQGYFVKTLVYQTVAEAQAPSIDALILGYGVATFFVAFIGLALYLFATVRGRFRRVQMLFLVFAVTSIYLPISAAKFLFVGSAAFALLPAEAIVRILDVANFSALRRDVASLSDRRSQFGALRRSLKLRHFLVIALVFGLLLPNVWYSVDAGIPYNSKTQYAQQIYNTTPTFLRGSNPTAALGAAGTQLDTPNQYDEAGYNWLAQQDQNLPEPKRPSFISWWDYGFQAVDQGLHPTVADNFQNGIVPAGNFLLSQNESIAIGYLATTLLVAEQRTSGNPYLPSGLNTLLVRDGLNVVRLHDLMVNTSQDRGIVLGNPALYLPYNTSNLDDRNSEFAVVAYLIAGSMPLASVAQLYGDIEGYTGWSISYAMVDSRLFPFTGQNTGIFYAPAQLTDRQIGAGGAPTAFYTLTAIGSDGKQYPVNGVPAGVATTQVLINRLAPFYHSMIYHIYVGYNGTDVGQSAGVPGVDQATASDPVEPGWMLQHFRVVYRTAYYCPPANVTPHQGCYATNLPDAVALAKKQNGTALTDSGHYFNGGESILQYYSGEPVVGSVTTSSGTPVSGARVTVYDSFGIPHQSVLTGSTGAYALVLPPGSVTINVTTGTLDGLSQAGTTMLASLHLFVPDSVALTPDAATVVMPVRLAPATVQTFTYWNSANNTSFIPGHDPVAAGATVVLWGQGVATRSATADASGTATLSGVPPGVYNFSVLYRGANYSGTSKVYATPGKLVNQTTPLTPASVSGSVRLPNGLPAAGALISASSSKGATLSAVANATGAYAIGPLTTGNYSISATIAPLSLASLPAAVTVTNPGQKLHQNLTLKPTVHVDVVVLANGAPLGGVPVRFSPIVSLAPPPAPPVNSTKPPAPAGPTSAALTNSSVFVSGSDGLVDAILPVGNYSVYALGLVAGSWYAQFSSAYLVGSGATVLPPLALAPAAVLSGTSTLPPGATASGPTQVTVYDGRGDQLSTFPNTTGAWKLWLPAGAYTLSAVEGANSARSTLYAALENLTVPTAGSVALELGPAVRLSAIVGLPTFTGIQGYLPAPGAVTRLSVAPDGGVETTIANATGNVTFVVPASLPSGSSYCLSAVALGFEPFRSCNLTPSLLSLTTHLPLVARPVSVTLTVHGLPSGTLLTVNLTANSSTAQSASATGGPVFNFTLPPGDYSVSAWARSPVPPGLILPTAALPTTVPLGAAQTNLTLTVIAQVRAHGALELPSGVTNTTVVLRFSSPSMNATVRGPTFQQGFFIAPGSYQLYATATGPNGTPYSNLSSVTVNRTGAFSSPVSLNGSGVNLTGDLLQASGAALTVNTTLTFTAPPAATISTPVFEGHYLVVVPRGTTFTPHANVTGLVGTPFGMRYESFRPVAGASCSAAALTSYCNITMLGSAVMTTVFGNLTLPGYPGGFGGTLRLVGPAPSTNVTTVTTGPGGFVWSALPGAYELYATTGTGAGALANVSLLTVPATSSTSIALRLSASWVDTVTVAAPPGANVSNVTLWIHGPPGINLPYSPAPLGVAVPFPLPYGVYDVQANATGAPFGVSATATAKATAVLTQGNVATNLVLGYQLNRQLTLRLLAPTAVLIPDPGVATFALSVSNVGNAPVAFHFVGSPSSFNFTFTPSNVTLGTAAANSTVSVQVRIGVPAGTPQGHPPVTIEAILNGALAIPIGTASPDPTVNLVPYGGLEAGTGGAALDNVGPRVATLPFYARNTGNIPETVGLGVANAQALRALGWSSALLAGTTPIGSAVIIGAGANESYSVKLTANAPVALPPGLVVVSVKVLNFSGAFARTVTIVVPTISVSANASTVTVTGPAVGSPPAYPDWFVPFLAFVPAIALVVAIVVYRWNKSRRWTRR